VEFSQSLPSHTDRQADFEHWVRNVREPARNSTEGRRRLSVHGAEAEYEIAPLPGGRWAVRMRIGYLCGNGSGRSSPWTEYPHRDQCVASFLDSATRHFTAELSGRDTVVNAAQRRARRDMLVALTGGLFGFIEPDAEPH